MFHINHITVFVDLNGQFSFHMHHILTGPLILQTPLIKQQPQAQLHIRTESFSLQLRQQLYKKKKKRVCTHSRYLVQGAGSDMAMKKQLVRIVNIMNRLNNVENGLRKPLPGTQVKLHFLCFCDVSYKAMKCSR